VRLVGADTLRPRLLAGAPGRIRLELRVSAAAGTPGAAAGRAASAESAGDEVDVIVQPTERVVRLGTGRADDIGSIIVGGRAYRPPAPLGPSEVYVIALDRATLEVRDPGEDRRVFDMRSTAIFDWLDRYRRRADAADTLIVGQAATGASTVRVAAARSGVETAAPVDGALVRDAYGRYSFAFTDQPTVEIEAPGTGRVRIGDQVYEAPPIAGPAIRLVTVDAGSLSPDGDDVDLTLGRDAGGIAALAAILAAQVQRGRLVVLTTVGDPTGGPFLTAPSEVFLNSILLQVRALGGTRGLLGRALVGEGSYTLVGRAGAGAAAEWLSPRTADGAAQTVVLDRDAQGLVRPALPDTSGGLATELQRIAFQDPTPWPGETRAGERAAHRFVAEALGYDVPSLRAVYVNASVADITTGDIDRIAFRKGQGFSAGELTLVKQQLITELGWVRNVNTLFENAQRVIGTSAQAGQVDLQAIGARVEADVEAPPSQVVAARQLVPLNLVRAGLSIITSFPVANSVKAVLGSLNGLLKVVNTFASQPDGTPLSTDEIRAQTPELARSFQLRMLALGDELRALQEVVLTDYGRLRDVAERARVSVDSGGWDWTPTAAARARDTLSQAARRTFYEQLLPLGFQAYRIPEPTGRGSAEQRAAAWTCGSTSPFAGTAPNGALFVTDTFSIVPPNPAVNASQELWVLGRRDSEWRVPSGQLLAGFYDPPSGGDGGGVGADPLTVISHGDWAYSGLGCVRGVGFRAYDIRTAAVTGP
jgi:hypothetical protein